MIAHQKGFTLIEMMVTLTLLALLASAARPVMEKFVQRKREEELQLALRQIREAIDRYHLAALTGVINKAAEEQGYPKDLSILVTGATIIDSSKHAKLYFLRRIPRDPMCDCRERSDEQTWKTRSSTSEPGNFDGGKDVYDVASSSQAKGLNGVPYAQW